METRTAEIGIPIEIKNCIMKIKYFSNIFIIFIQNTGKL